MQYRLELPEVLVGLHMLGAALMIMAAADMARDPPALLALTTHLIKRDQPGFVPFADPPTGYLPGTNQLPPSEECRP